MDNTIDIIATGLLVYIVYWLWHLLEAHAE